MQKMRNLLRELPKVRGRYLRDVPLAKSTWFRVGGPAQVTFKPADTDDLCFFMSMCSPEIPVHAIGVGSNLLVRDGGVLGVVVRLGKGFTNVFVDGSSVYAGAAVLDRNLAVAMCNAEVEGFEFLCGIPGTIGGALRMNAGAYGSDMSQILEYALAVDRQGKLHKLNLADMGYAYRHCAVPKDWIFVGAQLKGKCKGTYVEIQEKMGKFLAAREQTQPVKSRTGGSTFANPLEESAWKLIDDAGCRGLQIGGARVSELHCNFMLNTGSASAQDLEMLGEEVRLRVLARSGIELRWEIERLGAKLAGAAQLEKEKVA